METQDFQLNITNENGFTFKKNISETVCNAIVILAMKGIDTSEKEPQINSDSLTSQPKSDESGRIALNEYCQSLKPNSNKERITAIAMYLEIHDKSHLLRKDVPSLFTKAGFAIPKLPSRDIKQTVGKGWISAIHGSDDEFYPTEKGKKYFSDKKSK